MAQEKLTFSLEEAFGESLRETRNRTAQKQEAIVATTSAMHLRITTALWDATIDGKGLEYPEQFDDFLLDLRGGDGEETNHKNLSEAMKPERLLWAADVLMQNDQPEAAEAILVNEKEQPRFPDNFQSTRMLAEIAAKRDDGKRIVELLADGDGNPRFPEHMEALGVLLFGLDICNRFDDVIRIVRNLRNTDPNAWLEHEDIMFNYMSALNLSNRCAETIAEFLDNENHLTVPVKPTPLIMTRITIALDNQQQFERVLAICKPLYDADEAFRNNADFMASMAYALMGLRRYEEVRSLLIEDGNPRFPDNKPCSNMLAKLEEMAKPKIKLTPADVMRSMHDRIVS